MKLWERRRHERFKAMLDAYYIKFEERDMVGSSTITKDISEGGLCMVLTRPIKKREVILVELKFGAKRRVAVLAKIAWVRTGKHNLGNVCGLRFIWSTSQAALHDCMRSVGALMQTA